MDHLSIKYTRVTTVRNQILSLSKTSIRRAYAESTNIVLVYGGPRSFTIRTITDGGCVTVPRKNEFENRRAYEMFPVIELSLITYRLSLVQLCYPNISYYCQEKISRNFRFNMPITLKLLEHQI